MKLQVYWLAMDKVCFQLKEKRQEEFLKDLKKRMSALEEKERERLKDHESNGWPLVEEMTSICEPKDGETIDGDEDDERSFGDIIKF